MDTGAPIARIYQAPAAGGDRRGYVYPGVVAAAARSTAVAAHVAAPRGCLQGERGSLCCRKRSQAYNSSVERRREDLVRVRVSRSEDMRPGLVVAAVPALEKSVRIVLVKEAAFCAGGRHPGHHVEPWGHDPSVVVVKPMKAAVERNY